MNNKEKNLIWRMTPNICIGCMLLYRTYVNYLLESIGEGYGKRVDKEFQNILKKFRY